MLRHSDKRSILLLEGDKDARVFERFIDSSACDIEIGFGKQNVLGALDLLEEEGFQGAIGIIDADFDRLLGATYAIENVCVTDVHDLDLMIFGSLALDRYLREHVDRDLFGKLYQSDIDLLRSEILSKSLRLAYCRFVSERDGLRIYFKDLRHDEFISVDDLTVALSDLTKNLIRRSHTRCTVSQLERLVALEESKNHDPWQITNGHDVAAFLGIGLRRMIGSKKVHQTWSSEVEAGLRLAFDWAAFEATSLHRSVREWEAENKPFRIFPTSRRDVAIQ